MPALPPVASVLRVDLQWTDGSDNDVSTRQYFKYTGGSPTSSDCVTLAADIYGDAALMHAHWSAPTSLSGVKVTDLSSPSAGVGEHAQDTPGTAVGTDLPGSAAVLVNFLIARRYRGGKPRSYFPWGVAEDLVTRQQWSGTLASSIDSSLATYFGSVIGTTVGGTTITSHINVSYYDGFTVVTNPITGRARNVPKLRTTPAQDDILSWKTSTRVANQRRRNGR